MTATSLHLLILLLLVHFFSFSQLDDIIHLFTTLNTSWRSDLFSFFSFPLLESTNFICDQANVQGQQVYIRFVISEHFEIKAV